MPTLEQNLEQWNEHYNWKKQGEEWSHVWGGSEAQWFGSIYPRIHSYVPANTILEIAPGFGRWTEYLKNYSERLFLVDLSERCIEACERRFKDDSHITYCVNDGKSLSMIPDQSIDFVFCFDSLVHAEIDVIDNYLHEVASKLTRQGVGFIHHSNLGSYLNQPGSELPSGMTNPHWRAKSMSAEAFEKSCNDADLCCISQETINWGGELLTDCLSVFVRRDSNVGSHNQHLENPNFMREAEYISKLAPLYTRPVEVSKNRRHQNRR